LQTEALVAAQQFSYDRTMTATDVPSHIRVDQSGIAWIDNSRIKVVEIVMDWLANRSSAEEMHLQFPHLSIAQIHSALAYYYDHKDLLDLSIKKDLENAERLAHLSSKSDGRRKLSKHLN
jgi:uncharacterized protein (DUF433 family)